MGVSRFEHVTSMAACNSSIMMFRSKLGFSIASLTLAMIAVACGSSSSDDSAATGGGGTSSGGTNASSAGHANTAGAGNTTSSAGTSSAGTSSAAGTSSGGTSSNVAGSSSSGGSTSSGGSLGAAGSTNGSAGASGGSGGVSAGGSAGHANGGSGGTTGNAGAGGASSSTCPAVDPLKTNKAKQDTYDCEILAVSAKYGMPDPMIVKSQIQQESSFNVFAISGDSPCGTMAGWTDAESKSFGLIQSTPACGEATAALLPNGHPNLDQDMTSALWATSVFNPTINLDAGVQTDTDSLKALKKKYPGCTAAQYNMMAAGAFNSGDDAITGCGMYNARAQEYVTAITSHYAEFAQEAGWADPY